LASSDPLREGEGPRYGKKTDKKGSRYSISALRKDGFYGLIRAFLLEDGRMLFWCRLAPMPVAAPADVQSVASGAMVFRQNKILLIPRPEEL
jgi:hypothetical protein